MQTSTAWVGGGVRKTQQPLTPRIVKQDPEVTRRIMEAAAEAKARKETATREWMDAVRRFRSAGPTGDVGSDEATIFVERFTEGMPMAAYVLFRTTEVEEPAIPEWYTGSNKRHGLKGFFVRESRDQVLATHEWLAEEGGIVILRGKVRVIGRAQSGKSLHVELVEGFRLR